MRLASAANIFRRSQRPTQTMPPSVTLQAEAMSSMATPSNGEAGMSKDPSLPT
jgi:hypothetical protein